MDIDDFCAKQLVNVKFVKGLTRSAFIESLVYFQGAYDDAASFVELHEALAAREASGFNRVFFLSVPPSIFGTVCEMVSKHARAPLPGATRVLVEKPFGRDTQTFEELNALTSSAFEESEIFRVDHYLAKRCIQNLVQQRISRGVFFDEIWNNEHIASLHVSWKEDIDTGGRGGYFDQSGIIRDIMQNHLLQLFTFLTMEPSHSDTDALANKIDLLKAVGSIKMDDTFLGQFDGYLQDETVPNDSRCPTYAAARLTVDNQRWRGGPMLITAGKGLSVRNCTVEAKLKPGGAYDSILLRVQPEPGLWLRGPNGTMELPFMDAVPDTDIFDYERILFDGCRGSKLLMVGAQELREAWRIFTPLLHQIDSEQPQPVNHDFQAEQPAGMEEFARLAGVKLTAEDPLAEPSAAVMIQPKKLPQEPRVDTVQHAKSTGSLPQCKRPLTWFCTSQHLLEGKLGRALMFIQTACFLYSASILLPSGTLGGATEWSNSTVTLCPREVICAEGYTQLLMLFLSRGSAYFIYPALGSIFLTKCHAMNTWLSTTKVSLWIPLIDLHNLHAATGMLMAVMVLVHTAFHLARWAKRGELYLLFTDTAGVSGAVAVLAIIPVVVLMKLPRAMKKLVNWEIRKTAHMLSIPMAAALCFHTTRLFVFMIIVLAIYAADKIVQSFVCTHKITDSQWHRLANGVQLSFKSPAGWNANQLGYVNVAVPWISTTQWHPFSVYAHPTLEGYSAVCINTAGDWTRALHESISKPTTRPVWIQGPFASPYATSMEFDNLLLVASGIGITPALSCMHEFGNERRLSLLWMCRDAALLQFFLQVCPFDEIAFAVVYYTGKDPLEIPKGLSSSVSIISGRPNIQEVVGELMQSMEECLPLPSSMLEASTIFKIRSELAQSWLNAAQTPLKRFEVLIENLLSAGVSAVQLMSLFGFEQGRSSVEAECFERTLRRFGVSEEVFSSQEIDDVYNGLDTDGDGTIDRCEMHFFLSRLHHTGEGGGTH
jgi:glucose-6-phosphate 1-dehydrogenase